MNLTRDLQPLLSQIALGDQVAFRNLFNLYSDKVYGFAFRLTHSRVMAEEIVQDVFMKIWIKRESLLTIEYFPSYLYSIAKNHAFNMLKKLALEEKVKSTLVNEFPDYSDTEDTTGYREHITILQRVVAQLPPQQQLVYKLCHREGLKYEEVAQQLNISRLTVKTHMQKALRTIKTHLQGAISIFFVLFIGN